MTIASALRSATKAAAREILFGPRKPHLSQRWRKAAMTQKLRDERAAVKAKAVAIALAEKRAEAEVMAFIADVFPHEVSP